MINLKKLRKRFDTFCYQNRHKGIPNLMLYVAVTSGVIYFISLITQNYVFLEALSFNRAQILQGQVWRLFTGVFTTVFGYGNPLLAFISLYCFYSLGRALEYAWGTLRFNLYYFSGIVIMELFAMLLGGIETTMGGITYYMDPSLYSQIGPYINLSLLIAYATTYPDNHFLFMFIIPVKAWIFGLLYLVLTLLDVVQLLNQGCWFPHYLFPLVAFANYFLFVGSDIRNLFPFLRKKRNRAKPIYVKINTEKKAAPAYTHKCVLCGRTDASNPELEFRYCSRCNGYFCYCQDHINTHTHVE